MARSRRRDVSLNVYDLSETNQWFHPWGFGIFHSGVEVDGVEYTFGAGAGIFTMAPKMAPGARFRETISMGVFEGSSQRLSQIIEELRHDFGIGSYNVLTRNCNSFANDLCLALVGRPIPAYINRMAYLGSFMSCLIPDNLTSNAPVDEGGSQSGPYSIVNAPINRTSHSDYGSRNRSSLLASSPGVTSRTALANARTESFTGRGRTVAGSPQSLSPLAAADLRERRLAALGLSGSAT